MLNLGKLIFFLFFFSDADLLRDAQNILNTILQTEAINQAIQAGQALKDVLFTFSTVNVSPGIQQLLNFITPKVEAALKISKIAEKVRKAILGEDDTLVNFTSTNGDDLRKDGQKQTMYWQLQYLFRTKQDKADAVTMSKVADEIAKQLLNVNTGSGGGSTVDQLALRNLQVALSNLDDAFKKSELEQASINSSVRTARGDVTGINSKILALSNDLTSLKNRFQGSLIAINSVGPPLPGINSTIWEELHKLFNFLGKTNLDNFTSASDKPLSDKVNDLNSLVQAIPAEDLKNQILATKARIATVAGRVLALEQAGNTGITPEEQTKLNDAHKIAINLVQVVGGLSSKYDVLEKASNDPPGDLTRNARFFFEQYKDISAKLVIVYNLLGVPSDQTGEMIHDASQNIISRLRKIDEELAKVGTGSGSSGGSVDSSQFDALKQLYNNISGDLNSLTLQINKLNTAVGGSFVRNFDSRKNSNLASTIKTIENFYNQVQTAMKTLEGSIPQKKIEDVIGKDYISSFTVGTSVPIGDRLDTLEATGTSTSGTTPGRKYWYIETLRTTVLSSVSDLSGQHSLYNSMGSWSDVHKNVINTRYLYLPLDVTKHDEDLNGISMWDRGALRLFRGKCYIIVLLQFFNTAVQVASLKYQLAITNADVDHDTEVVIAKSHGVLDQSRDLKVSGNALNKIHIFHFRNTESVEHAMIRFNWLDSYPAYNSLRLDSTAMYAAPIYYNALGKAYMNPTPSVAQEISHPYLPDETLAYFGVITNNKSFMCKFLRMKLHQVNFDVSLMENRDGVKTPPEDELNNVTNMGWPDNQIIKIPNQFLYTQRNQGCYLHSWWGKQTSTQGIHAKSEDPSDNRLIRIFNHGSGIGEGLFLLTCELPEFMVFGLETHSYSVQLNMLSLFGIDLLCVEVIGVLHDNDDKGIVAADLINQFQKNQTTGEVTPFKSGDHDLATGLLAELNINPAIKFRSVLKKYIKIDQIAPDDITYDDPVTRNHLSESTKDAIMLNHNGLKSTTSFDLGTLAIDSDITQLFINVYPKFYGTVYDFACRANFGFKFGDGIMGEGVFVGNVGPSTYFGSNRYKI